MNVKAQQQRIAKLMRKVALQACPFRIGEVVHYQNSSERFTITEIHFCWNKEGYRLVGRRHGIYGGLTLQYRELWKNLDQLQLLNPPGGKSNENQNCAD